MKLLFTIIFFLISFSLFSQGINDLWLMGAQSWAGRPYGGTNLNFVGGVMDTSYESRIMNFFATCGVICDKNGNLLFSSDGVFIANAFNDTMLNGSGLNPSYYTSIDSFGLGIPQANLIIPMPGDSTKYYLFHNTDDDYFNTDASFYFYYSIIDMTRDNGKGAVIQKNVVLTTDTFIGGYLTACKHANGRDWWLMNHQLFTNKYFKYLVTPNGIQGPFTQDIGSTRGIYFGQMAFSPDGSKAAFYDPYNDLDLMDFDRCTGDFSNLIHVNINDNAILGGVAFSANSKVLYVSSDSYVYQFDLTSTNIAATQTTVAVYDGYATDSIFATTFGPAQLAPDGKIYIVCGNGTLQIHVINNPDSIGLGCNVCQHCIQLPSFNDLTVPNHPNYFLGADSGSVCDSLEAVQSYLVQSSKLEVFPNPVVGDEVTFTYNVSPEAGVIIIYTVEGEEAAHYSLPQWSSVQHIKLPSLANGLYLARLTQGNTTASVKFIKE